MLALLGLVTAALFTGASLFLSFAVHPATLRLAPSAALAHWQAAYPRAALMQAGLALVSGLAGIAAWYRWRSVWPWLLGGLFLLANIAWTLAAIRKTDKALQAASPEHATAETAAMLARWGRLHLVRTALGAIGTGFFVYGMTP